MMLSVYNLRLQHESTVAWDMSRDLPSLSPYSNDDEEEEEEEEGIGRFIYGMLCNVTYSEG